MILGTKKANKDSGLVTKDSRLENAMSWLQMGVDFESRRIEINYEVNEQMASFIIRALLKMSEVSNAPIELYLSSHGGVVYDGLAIYDAIQACPCPVTIYASGKIMSSAFIIFLAGDRRYAAKHTTFMMHSISYQGEGKVRDQEIDVLEAKRLNNLFLEIMASRTKMTKKWWYRQILSHDKYFDLKQAQECGIVTPPVVSKKKPATVTTKRKAKAKRRK